MMAILLFHTEVYYNNGIEIINYNLYVCDALIIFFFLSGYHFYNPDIKLEEHAVRLENLKRKLKKIFLRLVLPYFFFTSIIAFPKAIAHGASTDFSEILIKIISGNASWFIVALAIAETMFSTILCLCKGKKFILPISALIMFAFSIYLSTTGINYYWQFENACMAFSFLYLGYFFHEKENHFNHFNNIYYISILLLILIITKVYVLINGISMFIEPIKINNVPFFIINATVSIILMVNIAKRLPRIKMIEWTGRHSLVYYFFCGGVPLTISTIFNKIGFEYNGQYYRIILAFALVYLMASVITFFCYKLFNVVSHKNI